jgi:hypothetical protein
MSSFIVAKSCIDKILSHPNREIRHRMLVAIAQAAEIDYPRTFGALPDPNKIGQALWDLNKMMTDYRHSGRNAVDLPKYKYHHVPVTKIGALKALGCLSYQCMEGNCDEIPLYNALQEIKKEMAMDIVSDLPEWKANTNWGD